MDPRYIHPAPRNFGLYEMLLEIGRGHHFEKFKFEFVSYDPEQNDPDEYNNESRIRMLVPVAELEERGLDDIRREICRGDEVLGLGSFAKIDGGRLHIPQIDFSCEKSSRNETRVYEFLEESERDGYVLDSGRSYHFQGNEFLEHHAWVEFMKSLIQRSVDPKPLLDPRYPSIMLDLGHFGYSVLRLSANAKSKGTVPVVLARVGNKREIPNLDKTSMQNRLEISDDDIPF